MVFDPLPPYLQQAALWASSGAGCPPYRPSGPCGGSNIGLTAPRALPLTAAIAALAAIAVVAAPAGRQPLQPP